MRIPLFAHDANVRIDEPLCYKRTDQIVLMLQEKSIDILRDDKGREWAAQFKAIVARTLQSQLEKYVSISNVVTSLTELQEVLLSRAEDSTTGITDADCRANAGIVDGADPDLEAALILRARNKVAAWPHIHDDRNISMSGARWS